METLILIVSCVFIATGLGGILFIARKNASIVPKGGLQWMSAVMCVALITLSTLIIVLSLSHQQHDHHLTEFSQIQPFEFQLVSTQEPRDITDYRGQVVLLNFWATWCAPCITELPELDKLQSAYSDVGLVVVTVSDESLDEILLYQDLLPEESVSGFVDRSDLPESFLMELANGRPVTYVIDGEGIIRERIRGAGNFEYFESLVTPWLAQLELET